MLPMHGLRLLVLAASFLLLQTASGQRIQGTLGDRRLELGLLHLSDRKLVAWPDSEVRLTTLSVPAGTNLSLSDRLSTGGIEPDVGAYSLFYELNPKVTKVSAIPPDAEVALPKVVAGAQVQSLLASGEYLVVVFLDSDLRNKIVDASAVLQSLSDKVGRLPKDRFRSSQEQKDTAANIEDIAKWYGHIATTGSQRKGPPLNRQSLQQLLDEANALSETLSPFVDSSGRLPTQGVAQINAIHGDTQREIRRYDDVLSGGNTPDPDLVACCTVVVAIQGDAMIVRQLRVYYTLNGLFRTPPPGPVPGSVPFPELGSEKSRSLRAKNYMFWAAKEGAPDTLVTSPVMVSLDPTANNKPTRIDLLLLPKYNMPTAENGRSK